MVKLNNLIMIRVQLKILESNYQLNNEFRLSVLPSVGDQFLLSDFMDEVEEENLNERYPSIDLQSMFVESKVWLFDKEKMEPYVLVWFSQK